MAYIVGYPWDSDNASMQYGLATTMQFGIPQRYHHLMTGNAGPQTISTIVLGIPGTTTQDGEFPEIYEPSGRINTIVEVVIPVGNFRLNEVFLTF